MTSKLLEECPNGEVFACGVIEDSPYGIFLAGSKIALRWVAKKGDVEDFAVYVGPLKWSVSTVADRGDKVSDPETVKQLLQCDDEMLSHYRY